MKKKQERNSKVIVKEQQQALEVLSEFFEYATLAQSKEELWNWLQATVTGSFNRTLTFIERSNLVHFYNQLVKLMEAVFTLHLDNWEATIKKQLDQETLRA